MYPYLFDEQRVIATIISVVTKNGWMRVHTAFDGTTLIRSA